MAGTSNYPGALDNFSAASPTNLGDDDSTGRNHGERHDDLEAAVEAVQGELGINPAGTATTVVARLDGLDSSKAPVANPTFTGVASFPDGSASAPSVTNDGDTNTGLFFPAADTVAVTTGGTERLRVTSGGGVEITSASTFAPSLVVTNTNTGTSGPYFFFQKKPSDDALSADDDLGTLMWQGVDTGGTVRNAAYIDAQVTSQGATFVEPYLRFILTDSAGSAQERLRLSSNGLITGTGTSLGAWTAYTPTLGGTGWALGDGTITGAYCRIGKVVHFRAVVTFGSTSTYGAVKPSVSVPLAALSGAAVTGHVTTGRGRDSSAGVVYTLMPGFNDANNLGLVVAGSPCSDVTSTNPFTWASGDTIHISATYEAA